MEGVSAFRLIRKDVDGCTFQFARLDVLCQGIDIHHIPPAQVDQYGVFLHQIKLSCSNQVDVLRHTADMDADDIGRL